MKNLFQPNLLVMYREYFMYLHRFR